MLIPGRTCSSHPLNRLLSEAGGDQYRGPQLIRMQRTRDYVVPNCNQYIHNTACGPENITTDEMILRSRGQGCWLQNSFLYV